MDLKKSMRVGGWSATLLESSLFGNLNVTAQLTSSLAAFKCRIYNLRCIRAREQMSRLHQTSSARLPFAG